MNRLVALELLALSSGCRAAPAPEGFDRSPGNARPTLEEIFLEPPLQGHAPMLDSLSADGRFALLRWSPADAEPGRGQALLRLLDILAPAKSGHRGTPLEELLRPVGGAGDGERVRATQWSPFGHELALVRGPDVLLFDPESTELQPVFLGSAEPAEGASGELVSVAFAKHGDELRFSDRQELWSVDLTLLRARGTPFATSELRAWSSEVVPPALDLEWSDDLSVVFARITTPHGAEREGESAPEVWRVLEERGVVLEGMAGLDLEDADLSPDGRFVFATEMDRAGAPVANLIPDFLTPRVSTTSTRAELADDLPSPRVLWMWSASDGRRDPIDRIGSHSGEAEEAPGRFWFNSIGWAPMDGPGAPARFAFELTSLDHRELEIWCWTEGFCERIWCERDEQWIGGPARMARWSEDGQVLLVASESTEHSSTPGRSQLFAVDPDNKQARQLSAVAGEIDDFVPLADGSVLVSARLADPALMGVGRLPASALGDAAPAEVEFYPCPRGWNDRPRAARDGSRIVFAHEERFAPTELWTADLSGAARLTRTVPRAFEETEWIRPERLEVVARDGARVHAQVYLPRGVDLEGGDPSGPRATIVFVHGAGYLQNVSESMTRYPLNLMFHSRLASLGYPVVDVDYRGSAGYGRDFRTALQYHLGGKDLSDIHDVVDALVERGIVDPERVGLYGGSYGGFLTLMALFTAGERWSCGAALRSVTDWRTYAPEYTQPRLGRPSTHADAYALSSPIDHAAGLADPLLILHGMRDGNVFAQDSIRLIETLIDLGKDFESQLYPSQDHGFTEGASWLDEYKRIERFFLQHLGPPRGSDPSP